MLLTMLKIINNAALLQLTTETDKLEDYFKLTHLIDIFGAEYVTVLEENLAGYSFIVVISRDEIEDFTRATSEIGFLVAVETIRP